MLYIVPTPIGNLGDITLRAIEVLKAVDIILAEDTRTSGVLLKHYGIPKKMMSYHQHNEHKIVPQIVEELESGKTIALLTDAGTPGLSDPAFLLVRACVVAEIKVSCLPGATAAIPALVNSGLPMNRFCFEGFIPLKKGRQTYLKSIENEERTLVFYESPHRLVKTLKDFETYFGAERQVCVSREISKMFEENKRGTLIEVIAYYEANPPKGEIVIVLEGKEKN